MVWCYCYHLRTVFKFCENRFPTQWVAEIGCKDNERYLNKYSHNRINPVLHAPKHIYWYKMGYIYTLTL